MTFTAVAATSSWRVKLVSSRTAHDHVYPLSSSDSGAASTASTVTMTQKAR